MGKKNKEKSSFRSSSLSANNEFCLQDEVIQHLQLLKESKRLVIGLNAVVRGIENNCLCVIIYISRRGTSAMYHALNLMCKGKDILFLQLKDINSIFFTSKIPSSTTYGIKKSIIEEPQFSKFLEKINMAKNLRKSQKKIAEKFCLKNKDVSVENQSLFNDSKSKNPSKTSEVNCMIHSKHDISKQTLTGNGMLNFQEVDFPNYKVIFH